MAILKLGNNNSAFSGSFSGSFQGNGSQLTNLPITDPFPLNGNATITGSLTVSSSFADFSGLTDIKTRKFAITSDHVSGQTVTSASFYDSFVEALDASVDGDTLHVFSNDSSSVTNDIFEEKNITIVGNGFHFDIVGAGTNNYRWTFTSCSIDVYDFEFRRTPTSNLSNFDTSVWEIKGPSNWHFYNSGFAATKNAHALMIEGNNINIDGVYARLTDSTSYLTYAVYKDTTTNDFTLENFDIHSEAGGIFAQGDRVKIENGNIDYSTTIDRSNAITITGHTGSISNVNILGNDDNSQNVALRIDPTTGANSRGITFIENVNIRSGEITVQNDAHVIIGDCKVFNIQQRSDCLYFAGTGSITNCNIEYDERMGGYTSGAAGIKLHTSQEVRISNCHVFGYQFGLENTYPENIITVYNSYFETGLSYSGNGKAIYGLDTKTATIVGCQGVINLSSGQGFGLDLQTTGSGKIHILNSDFINKGPASSYGQCFRLIGSSANNEIYVSDVNAIIDAPNDNSATSAALSISGVTGSYFNNLYVEGYAAGTINAISSSIVNSTFYQKKIASTATAWTLNAAGNENLYSNCIFEVDPEFDAYNPDFLIVTSNTQRYHNSTFKGGKDPNYRAITGSGAANVELIGNRFINVPYANITASNVTDITTGYIDGRGNWHKSQTTSSFDHIEATSFKGDGSQLTNLPIFPHTASSAAIISRSFSSGDTDSTALRLIGSGSISSSGIFEIEGSAGPLFSVQDGLDGVLMEVNNITGLPLFQVSSSNEVFINRGNLTSGTTTATASFAHFTGSFQGDGSQLTGVDAFPFTGDAQITGSLTISGSFASFRVDTDNVILGSGAAANIVNGAEDNVIIGTQAAGLGTITTAADKNVLIGYQAGYDLTAGNKNVFLGHQSGYNITSGDSNIGIGEAAGYGISTGNNNINIGQNTGVLTNGAGNVTMGYYAGVGSSGALPDYCVFIGYNAGRLCHDADWDIAIGYNALYNLNDGNHNIAIGRDAGYNITDGHNNIIIGSGSLGDAAMTNQLRIGNGNSLVTISASLATGDVIFYNTASAPNFSGSFQGDGSQLTGITATAGSTAGKVVFTTTNGELTTESGFEYNSTTNQLSVDSLNVIHLTSSFITSSRIHTSGSNIFGDDTTDTQTLIGTTKMTGSAEVTGSVSILGDTQITGSLKILPATNINAPVKIYGAGASTVVGFGDNSTRFTFGSSGTATMVGFKMYSGILAGGLDGGSQVINKLDRLELGGYGFGGTSVIGMVSPAGTVTVPGNGFAMYPNDANGAGTVSPHFKTEDGSILTLATTSSLKRVTADSSKISGSGGLTVESSGSTVFEVIGSEGTLFSVDDDLDGTIFTANDKTGIPVLEASASGEVYIGKSPQSLYTTAVISSTTANISQSIYGLSTSSYSGVFVDYTANSGSNARAGSIMSAWNGSNLNFTETTTLDIGDTSDLIMQVAISQSQAQVQSYASRAGYNIKTIIRSI